MIITTAAAPAAIGPYVQGVNLGTMTMTSGQLRSIRRTAPCLTTSLSRRDSR